MEPSEYSDEQLVASAGTGAAVQWIPIEMMRRLKDSIKKLDDSVNALNKTSSKQATKLIWLTWAITILTVILVFGLVVQLYLAIADGVV